MAEKIYESTIKEDGKFKLECPECYYELLIDDAEKDDVFECSDCGTPFTVVDVSEDKIQIQPVIFDEEDWRE